MDSGECGGGQNVTVYSEDQRKTKNVGGPEVRENDALVKKDIATQLHLDVSSPSQRGCFSFWKSKKRPRILISGDEQSLHAANRFKESYGSNYGRAPLNRDLFADSARFQPSVNEDAYGGGFRTRYASQRNGASETCASLAVHPSHQESTHQVNPIVKYTDKINEKTASNVKVNRKMGANICFQREAVFIASDNEFEEETIYEKARTAGQGRRSDPTTPEYATTNPYFYGATWAI